MLLLPTPLLGADFARHIIADAKVSTFDEAVRAYGPDAYLSMPKGRLHLR